MAFVGESTAPEKDSGNFWLLVMSFRAAPEDSGDLELPILSFPAAPEEDSRGVWLPVFSSLTGGW